jgi:hypothetical protein
MPICKRELAAYLALLSLNREEITIDQARSVLELLFPKRSVKSVLRILSKSGFIDIDSRVIKVKDPRKALEEYLIKYIIARIKRNLRSRHIRYSILKDPKENYIISIAIDRKGCYDHMELGKIKIIFDVGEKSNTNPLSSREQGF